VVCADTPGAAVGAGVALTGAGILVTLAAVVFSGAHEHNPPSTLASNNTFANLHTIVGSQ
jgi:hypothetical protein